MATRSEAEELLRTLFADPEGARRVAEQQLVTDPDPAVGSVGHQIVGIVLRDLGETADALHHLDRALTLARAVDDVRESDVRATLGGTLVHAGRTREGLAHLDSAAEKAHGLALATVLVRRARVLVFNLERLPEGVEDLRRALEILDATDDPIWRARALHLEGLSLLRLGDVPAAKGSFARSLEIHEALDMASDVAVGVHTLGWVAFVEGDLPRALEMYADASRRFDQLSITSVDLVYDQSIAYLAGGLARDSLEVVERALDARPLLEVERLDLLLALAGAALRAGEIGRARSAADEARTLARRHDQRRHWLSAEMLAISARIDERHGRARLLDRVAQLVEASRAADSSDLPRVLVLGADVARRSRAAHARGLERQWLEEAAGFRRSRLAATRSLGWQSLARRRDLAGDRAGVLRACERGLVALEEHHATFGSQELRAQSSAHGADLTELGTRTALASGDTRRLLVWSERWRATALAAPARSRPDHETVADLAALRSQVQRLAEARAADEPTDRLEARAARLEQSVRRRLLQSRGSGETGDRLDVPELLEALAADGTTFVELVEVDGTIHALVAGRGRVRRLQVGPAVDAGSAMAFALFSLRQAARGRRHQLDAAGARLERALLGRALDRLGDERVVVSGTSALQGVPWGLVPALADRAVTSTPSARLWLRARGAQPADADRRVMVVGPGLGSGGAEVPAVAAQDPTAEVLDGGAATVEAALGALDGAALAHVAAHGHFREDSPLFSSLTMADGPLLVHDLQRLERPPHRVVLSACESGEMAPVGAQELLGLSAALLSMGTAGIVSSLGEVDDAATVEVMVALHASLRRGEGLGEALLAARQAADGDQVLAATAASFTVLGR